MFVSWLLVAILFLIADELMVWQSEMLWSQAWHFVHHLEQLVSVNVDGTGVTGKVVLVGTLAVDVQSGIASCSSILLIWWPRCWARMSIIAMIVWARVRIHWRSVSKGLDTWGGSSRTSIMDSWALSMVWLIRELIVDMTTMGDSQVLNLISQAECLAQVKLVVDKCKNWCIWVLVNGG